ncbi:MAG: cytochrome c [Acetobacteraceae bacterium]
MVRVCQVIAAFMLLAGCRQSMIEQWKYSFDEPSQLWSNGTSSRPLPDGVVAQGDLQRDRDAATPPPVTMALLNRGQQRFQIYCVPCHGVTGEGNGMIVHRGFPAPPSYHTVRLRAAPAQHFFDVITNGYGVMYPYAARVTPRDRWAIVAYIRALQTSRTVALSDMPEARDKLPADGDQPAGNEASGRVRGQLPAGVASPGDPTERPLRGNDPLARTPQ